MGTWTLSSESLPTPGDETLYIVTADWGFGRPLQLIVVRFDPTPGKPERGIWRLPYWPHRVFPREAVKAWMPAPEPWAEGGAA